MSRPTPLSDSNAFGGCSEFLIHSPRPSPSFPVGMRVGSGLAAHTALGGSGWGERRVRARVGQGFEDGVRHGRRLLLVPVAHRAEEVERLRRIQLIDIIFTLYHGLRVDRFLCPQKYLSALLHLPSGSVCRLLQCALLLESF